MPREIATSGNYLYNKSELESMSYNKLWRGNLEIINDRHLGNTQYELHPTGDCDLNGRKFLALPTNTNVKDPEIIRKYNLMYFN